MFVCLYGEMVTQWDVLETWTKPHSLAHFCFFSAIQNAFLYVLAYTSCHANSLVRSIVYIRQVTGETWVWQHEALKIQSHRKDLKLQALTRLPIFRTATWVTLSFLLFLRYYKVFTLSVKKWKTYMTYEEHNL